MGAGQNFSWGYWIIYVPFLGLLSGWRKAYYPRSLCALSSFPGSYGRASVLAAAGPLHWLTSCLLGHLVGRITARVFRGAFANALIMPPCLPQSLNGLFFDLFYHMSISHHTLTVLTRPNPDSGLFWLWWEMDPWLSVAPSLPPSLSNEQFPVSWDSLADLTIPTL